MARAFLSRLGGAQISGPVRRLFRRRKCRQGEREVKMWAARERNFRSTAAVNKSRLSGALRTGFCTEDLQLVKASARGAAKIFRLLLAQTHRVICAAPALHDTSAPATRCSKHTHTDRPLEVFPANSSTWA